MLEMLWLLPFTLENDHQKNTNHFSLSTPVEYNK